MDEKLYQAYVAILEEELIPAMGCTEPIAVAYCAAWAKKALGCTPETVAVHASANIIKNVKSVVVPNTGGQRGIAAAAAAGIVSGRTEAELQVLAELDAAQIGEISALLDSVPFTVDRSDNDYIFDIQVELTGGGHTAFAQISGFHTNLIELRRDDEVLLHQDYAEQGDAHATDRTLLNVEQIVNFADCVNIDDVREVIGRQISYNRAIAEEGLRGDYGANIGSILLKSYGNSVHNRAKAYAAAGSDGRMNGCELPVVINSGSGNQGLTASLPVIVYAEELKVSEDMLYRALVISNLVTIHLKTGIGRLSAYCGAISAGVGAGAGICYLLGGDYDAVAHTVVDAVAILSGTICDGAKPSCAAKIAAAVDAGIMGYRMYLHHREFRHGEGIVGSNVDDTIAKVGVLAQQGMRQTDRTILDIMQDRCS